MARCLLVSEQSEGVYLRMAAMTKEVALRIALANRALPGIEIQRLLGVLHDRLGAPLSVENLGRITVTDLKTGLGSADGEEDGEDLGPGLANLKTAVQILWGDVVEEELPALEQPLDKSDGVVRVAVASNAAEQLNGHFGTCIRFLVYDLSADNCRLVAIRATAPADLTDDKNAARADLIGDCQVLFVISIGGPAAAKVIRRGIYPLKQEAAEARAALTQLQQTFNTNPAPWLAKLLGRSTARRVSEPSDEAETWNE
jgi:nitrogen fixation protein NifX